VLNYEETVILTISTLQNVIIVGNSYLQ